MADPTAELDGDAKAILEGDGVKAAYKIEITFGKDRSSLKPYAAFVSLWESGKHLHGGGDGNMYFCLDCRALRPDTAWKQLISLLSDKEPSKMGCGRPISADTIGGGIAFCPHCQKHINSDNITSQLPFYGTSQDLAKIVARYFDVLKQNADVYAKYHPTDIRYTGMQAAKGLEVARRLRGMFIYPMSRILRDLSGGSSLESRFRVFINA